MKRFLLIVAGCLILTGVQAQKVKYKDLFVFLSAKQYAEAEPLLKKYLKENDDNPNAFMHMGYIYEEKCFAADPLKEFKKVSVYGDSAVYFLELANKNMTEKEIKKNSEYYEKDHSRRNIRTGEFGIELSDVVNHLGDKSKEVRERQQKVAKLTRYFYQAVGIYDRLLVSYEAATRPFDNMRQLYLRSNDSLLTVLEELPERQDSLTLAFNSYKSVLKQMGNTKYDQVLELIGIKDFKTDGRSGTDFFGEKLSVWDFNFWAQETIKAIKKDLRPQLSRLVAIDADLSGLRNKVSTDSVSVTSELDAMVKNILSSELIKFDADPMPHAILLTKIAEIRYNSETVAGRKDRKSEDLSLRKAVLEKEVDALKLLDSLSAKALARNLEQEAVDYKGFVTETYGSLLVMQSFLRTGNDYAKNQFEKTAFELNSVRESMKWIIDNADSIPAMEGVESDVFYPLFIQEESFTTGTFHRDDTSKVMGYFYTINKDRKPQVKAVFPLSHEAFHFSKRALMHGTVKNAVMGLVYFSVIWSEERHDEKIPVVISKIYSVDGLSWSNIFWIDDVPDPDGITVTGQTGEISLKVSAPDGPKTVIISKDGKMM